MPQDRRNIYKIAREAKGLTQEAAAEKLGISDSSIRAYETGQRVPPDEVVETKSDLYNALHLIVRHVRERNAMYSRVVPEVPQCSVLEASAKLTNRIYAFADSHADRRLMQMAEDNVIDSAERPEFDAIMEDLQGIVEAAMAVRYAKQGHLEEGVE